MSKNNILAINRLALLRDFHTVDITFRSDSIETPRSYTYKSSFECKVGDEVIVCAPSGDMVIVDVVAVRPYAELPSPDKITYKWLVQKVAIEEYKKFVEDEAKTSAQLEAIRSLANKDKARVALYTECADSPEALKALDAFFGIEEAAEVDEIEPTPYYDNTSSDRGADMEIDPATVEEDLQDLL
jgi:hypothetical protein